MRKRYREKAKKNNNNNSGAKMTMMTRKEEMKGGFVSASKSVEKIPPTSRNEIILKLFILY